MGLITLPSLSYLVLAIMASSLLLEAVLYCQAVPANNGTKVHSPCSTSWFYFMKSVIFINGTLSWPKMERRAPDVNAPRWQEVTRVSKTFWILFGNIFGYFRVLPLRILNVSMAHANPNVQLRLMCVSVVKVFQGLFSYTFFVYVFSIGTRIASAKKKKKWKCTSCSAKCLAETSFSCTVGAAGKWIQFQWFPHSLVHGVQSKKWNVSACWIMLVPVGRQRICVLFQPCNTHLRGWGCSIKERHTQASLAKHAFQIKPQHSGTDSFHSHSE